MTGAAPETDIVSLLLVDHAAIEERLTGQDGLTVEQRSSRFDDLVHQIVRHEMGEERIVYPELRIALLDGEEVAAELVEQEREVDHLLATVRRLDSDRGDSATVLDAVRHEVLRHMQAEELHLLPRLRMLETDRRWELGNRYLKAVRTAPILPHPRAPRSRIGTATAGRVAGIIDHARVQVERALK